MEKLIPKKINLSNINGGNKFVNGDIVTATTINDIIQGIAAVPSPDSGSTGGGEVAVGSSVRRTVLWEGNLNDSELKTYFNSNANNEYYYLPLNNLPESISDEAMVNIEIQLNFEAGNQNFKILKKIIKMEGSFNNKNILLYGLCSCKDSLADQIDINNGNTLDSIVDISADYIIYEDSAEFIEATQFNCLRFFPVIKDGNLNKKSGSIFNKCFLKSGSLFDLQVVPINNINNSVIDNSYVVKKVTLVEVL